MAPTSPLLTIVVPTRNRPETALLSVKTLLEIPEERLEVAVQDCSDDDRLASMLAAFSDRRVVYRHGDPVSMTANWNRAMDLVSGEYVCFIGDDDGVHPHLVLATRWAERNGLDAFASPRPAWFCWSDHPRTELASTLWLDRFDGRLEYPDGQVEIRKSSFGFGQRIQHLPRVYHGVVKRRVLEDLKRRTGKYFDGFAPDFYSAHAVGALVGRYCIVDFPLTIAGASRSSNAGRTNDPRYNTKAAYMLHFSEFGQMDVPDIVPAFRGYASSVCSSMLLAFENLGRTDLVANVDLPLLYASTLMEAAGERRATLSQFVRAARKLNRPLASSMALLGLCWAARLAQRPLSRVHFRVRRAARQRLARGIDDIRVATEELGRVYGTAAQSFPQPWLE